MNGLSDSLLQKLWRQAVLKLWQNKCAFCGNQNTSQLGCHHIVRRKHAITRHDPTNGIPLCSVGCHSEAHTKLGEARIEDKLGEPAWIRLCNLERVNIKDYLLTNGLSRAEFLQGQKDNMLKIING